jgi:hypothetical protein
MGVLDAQSSLLLKNRKHKFDLTSVETQSPVLSPSIDLYTAQHLRLGNGKSCLRLWLCNTHVFCLLFIYRCGLSQSVGYAFSSPLHVQYLIEDCVGKGGWGG